MNCRTKCHRQAMSEVMELTIIGGLIALVADCAWMAHDIYENGMSLWYLVVAIGLVTGTGITAIALHKHHQHNYKTIAKNLLASKLKIQKAKMAAKKARNKRA